MMIHKKAYSDGACRQVLSPEINIYDKVMIALERKLGIIESAEISDAMKRCLAS
jgi:hypothetical protein